MWSNFNVVLKEANERGGEADWNKYSELRKTKHIAWKDGIQTVVMKEIIKEFYYYSECLTFMLCSCFWPRDVFLQ